MLSRDKLFHLEWTPLEKAVVIKDSKQEVRKVVPVVKIVAETPGYVHSPEICCSSLLTVSCMQNVKGLFIYVCFVLQYLGGSSYHGASGGSAHGTVDGSQVAIGSGGGGGNGGAGGSFIKIEVGEVYLETLIFLDLAIQCIQYKMIILKADKFP